MKYLIKILLILLIGIVVYALLIYWIFNFLTMRPGQPLITLEFIMVSLLIIGLAISEIYLLIKLIKQIIGKLRESPCYRKRPRLW